MSMKSKRVQGNCILFMIQEEYMQVSEGMTCYKVGDKFDKVMGGDGAIFEMQNGMCFMYIGLTDMAEIEFDILSSNELDVYLSCIDDIVFISASFEDEMLFDMPFNAALYKEFDFDVPNGRGYLCPVFVIDNRTNIIKALRVVGLDAGFSEKLYELAMEQRKNGIDSYDERLDRISRMYSPRDIINRAVAKNKKGLM